MGALTRASALLSGLRKANRRCDSRLPKASPASRSTSAAMRSLVVASTISAPIWACARVSAIGRLCATWWIWSWLKRKPIRMDN